LILPGDVVDAVGGSVRDRECRVGVELEPSLQDPSIQKVRWALEETAELLRKIARQG
jgi:hypothetical protein